jgi:two-component system alkaline phosphatase synthesis response regulator PhoP
MSAPRILVVEDDPQIQELVGYNLGKEGYVVLSALSAETALRLLEDQPVDLVILDLMLPGMDGMTLCRRLKGQSKTQDIPVIMLTAKSEEGDIVAGLEIGADDYIPKPFSPRLLIARIRAVLRRSAPAAEEECYTIGSLTVDRSRHEVRCQGQTIPLTPTEFAILDVLASRPGRVLSRSEIAESVHGEPFVTTDRAVDVHIAALRRKLGPAGQMIETVRGIGYRIRD